MRLHQPSSTALLLLSAFLLAAACRAPAQAQEAPPNIVLMLVDDLGKEWVSAYGAEDIETPHVDSLAAHGMLFNHAYSMPQCTPSRVTLLTGQYPFRHGWINHWDVPRWGGGAHFDETLNPSLAVGIQQAGYRTCIAGKWQIDDFRVEPDALSRNGFDEYCMWTGYESGVPASAERYHDPYLFTREGSQTYEGQFGPDVLRDFVVRFIQANHEAPFFIYYPMVLTHPPLVDTPDETASSDMGKHRAMVRYADQITGEVVAALKDAGVLNNTLIIWTTDNGTSRGIVGRYRGRDVEGAKAQTTEAGVCMPFIAHWPDQIARGTVTDALVDFSDLSPTLLDVAGAPPAQPNPADSSPPVVDGVSFKPVLLGQTNSSPREWIMSMGGGNHARRTEQGVENQYSFRDRVIRNQRYKLYVSSQQRAEKFYDLQQDPTESHNLLKQSLSSDEKENLAKLSRVMKSFPRQDNDFRYVPNPEQPWDVPVTAESQAWKQP